MDFMIMTIRKKNLYLPFIKEEVKSKDNLTTKLKRTLARFN